MKARQQSDSPFSGLSAYPKHEEVPGVEEKTEPSETRRWAKQFAMAGAVIGVIGGWLAGSMIGENGGLLSAVGFALLGAIIGGLLATLSWGLQGAILGGLRDTFGLGRRRKPVKKEDDREWDGVRRIMKGNPQD